MVNRAVELCDEEFLHHELKYKNGYKRILVRSVIQKRAKSRTECERNASDEPAPPPSSSLPVVVVVVDYQGLGEKIKSLLNALNFKAFDKLLIGIESEVAVTK